MTDSECRGCGAAVDGAGRVCDRCEVLEVDTSNCSAGWKAEARHQRASAGRDHE
jgi:predicted amidophosphoribosyltransferase